MTDRELLEMAAKAAGIKLDTAVHGEVSDKNCHARIWDRSAPVRILFYSDSRVHPMCRTPSEPGNVEWNPLADDGDALRLAVKLNIDLYMPCTQSHVRAIGRADICIDQPAGTDPAAATRRAIVRAAAAIGEKQ